MRHLLGAFLALALVATLVPPVSAGGPSPPPPFDPLLCRMAGDPELVDAVIREGCRIQRCWQDSHGKVGLFVACVAE